MKQLARDDGQRCSGGSVLELPWTCGSTDCGGRRPDCTMRRRNETEQEVLAKLVHNFHTLEDVQWEQAWRRNLGLELLESPTLRDVRKRLWYR